MTKQEKTTLNMAKFIQDQALVLIGKLDELGLDDQADTCEQLHEQADQLYKNLAECFQEYSDV
jgi:hypothetical protein